MEPRMNIETLQPAGYEAMLGLEKYLQTTKLSPVEKGLIKVRASQINHCAFCIKMHISDALRQGEDPQRMFLLDAWRETNIYTETEKVILEMTEEITFIHRQGLTEATHSRAKALLGAEKLAQVVMAIATINAWNRITIAAEMGFSIKL
ncbi:carboxymuconolactone decarboxylase family protein [Taibaiella koreensis]|uniref:carboxymuconolactone decarboxylase family protein n=1 Tax=Taibaiella koreensis TaxID=1268548 RepID=UPI000E59954E|nr:carboxymuconolactone decarboxylase family protein [Taibaiella koreensis]